MARAIITPGKNHIVVVTSGTFQASAGTLDCVRHEPYVADPRLWDPRGTPCDQPRVGRRPSGEARWVRPCSPPPLRHQPLASGGAHRPSGDGSDEHRGTWASARLPCAAHLGLSNTGASRLRRLFHGGNADLAGPGGPALRRRPPARDTAPVPG